MTQNSTNQITTNQSTGTPETGMEGNLGNSNANILKGKGGQGSRKWILYLVGDRDPLLGFVHANSREEALDKVAKFGRKVIAIPADPPAISDKEMTPERVARWYQLFGSVVPAYSEQAQGRTAYFYRKEAVEFARMARQCYSWETSFRATCIRLAKSYLAQYRFAKSTAA